MAMQGIYRVEGRNEVFVLEDDKWRYVCTEAVLFQAGYSWDDVQVIPVAEWCKYEVGYPMPGGWADPSNYGYFPHRDFYIQACAVAPPPPPPPETLKCPLCEYDLGIVGLRVEVIEPGFTTETITHACGAKIQYQVSPVAAHNVVLACPYDGASLGVNGISGSAVITNIDEMASKLQGEIAALNNKLAELQGRIEALRVQVAEATEIIGG